MVLRSVLMVGGLCPTLPAVCVQLPRDRHGFEARRTGGATSRVRPSGHAYDAMKGDRVEAVVDTGQGTQTFEITASRAGRRIEVTTARGVVEVTEVTRGGTPVRTGRFMANRLIALVEHPAQEQDKARVEVTTRRRIGAGAGPAAEKRAS